MQELKLIVARLLARLPEIEYYADKMSARVQPEKYPKGLFRTAQDYNNQYKLSSYLDEIKTDIHRLADIESSLMTGKAVGFIAQKIQVLINSLRAQKSNTNNSLQQYISDVELADKNAFTFLTEKNSKLLATLHNRVNALTETLSEKEFELKRAPMEKKAILQSVILSLQQEIGSLNKKISQLEEG